MGSYCNELVLFSFGFYNSEITFSPKREHKLRCATGLFLRLAYHTRWLGYLHRSLKREGDFNHWIGRLTRMIDIDDQVEACRRVFTSNARRTAVRGSNL